MFLFWRLSMKKWLAAISLAALCLCGAAGICEGNEISADVSTDVRTQSVPEISDETIVTSEGSAILVPMSVGETAVNWKNADGELLGEFTFRVNEENSLSVADGANYKVGLLDVLEDASGEDGEHSFGSISSLMKGIGAAVCEDCGALKLTMMPAVKTVTSDENVLRTEGPAILIPVNAGDAVVTWTNEKGETIGELAIHVDEKLALTVEKINYSCDELLDLFDLAAEIGNGHRFGEIVSVGKNICIAQYKDSNAVQLIALRNGSSKSNTSGTSGSKKPGSSKHSKPDSEDYDDQDDQDDDQDGQDDDQDGQDDDQDGQDDDQDDDDDTCLHSFGSWSRGSESRHVRICEKCGYQQWQNHNFDYDGASADSHTCSVCGRTDACDYGSWEQKKDQHTHTCSVCGGEEAGDHILADAISGGDGTHRRECEVCGYAENANCSYGAAVSNNDGTHSYTCTECGYAEKKSCSYGKAQSGGDGTHSAECSVCGYRQAKQVCVYGEWVSGKDGTHSAKCLLCGYEVSGNCTYGAWSGNADGTHKQTCSICGYAQTESCSISEWKSNNDGTHTGTCSVCSDVQSESCASADGTAVTEKNGYHVLTCAKCSAKSTVACTYGEWSKGDTVGTHTHTCSVCSYTKAEACTYTDWTNNENGTHTGVCTVCEAENTVNCNFGAWVSEGGQHTAACMSCGFTKSETCSPQGEYVTNNDGTHYQVCAVCSGKVTSNCSISADAPASPDPSNSAQHIGSCTLCGGSVAAPHEMGTWSQGDESGKHIRSCSVCGQSETQSCTYSWSVPDTMNPTHHVGTCSVCGGTKIVDGHQLSGWESTEIIHSRYCMLCAYRFSEGHTWSAWSIYITGGKHYRMCSTCNYLQVASCSSFTPSGAGEHKCTDCGTVYYCDWIDKTEGGVTTQVCKWCGQTKNELGSKAQSLSGGNASTESETLPEDAVTSQSESLPENAASSQSESLPEDPASSQSESLSENETSSQIEDASSNENEALGQQETSSQTESAA